MGTIRIEFVPIKKYNLGLIGLDHLQLVYEDETSFVNKQDNWYVIEGTQDGPLIGGTLGVLGEDGALPLSSANLASGDALVELIGTPEARGSRIVYQGPDAFNLWQQMANYASEIEANAYPYEVFSWPFSPGATINSSSVIATLLNIIGINIASNMPLGVRLSPGTSTVLGTTGDDDITVAGSFTQVAAGLGQDVLRGTETLLLPEKFYGGFDDDTIVWSKGENIVHGGQPSLAYAQDGIDTIDYAGVGQVRIIATKHAVEHKVPTFISEFNGGSDQLFSIEKLDWFRDSDIIDLGQGVELLEAPIRLRLDQASGGRGDELGFQNTSAPLIINVVDADMISVQTQENAGEDAGYWAQSVEWLAGSSGNDSIYGGGSLKGIDGGDGNDLVHGRLSDAFSRNSVSGFDIELSGGSGNDTVVSGTGYSWASGGEGSDRFVLSSMTTPGGETAEFIIADADAQDTLYIPYDFFQSTRGDFDGSQLMQLRGAPFKITDTDPVSLFFWGPVSDDQEHGNIDFVGLISFTMEGTDLVISLMQGHIVETDFGTGILREVVGEGDTETFIRVLDFEEGDLGITFPLTFDPALFGTTNEFYPGFDAAVAELVNPSVLTDPLTARPEAYLPQDIASAPALTARIASFAALLAPPEPATDGNDIINAPDGGPYQFDGLGGNDSISGSAGGDVIDGGSGNDTMAGGRGNDAYFVDSAGDVVIEDTRNGFDHVYASVDYALTTNVEHLTLSGSAVFGTGNELRNTISGNGINNVLSGGGGDDTLAGNGGADTLAGGAGNDGYVYELGDGDDVIIETEDGGNADVLVFAGQMSVSDFVFTRSPLSNDDLIIRFFDGGSITIAGYYLAAGGTIEGIEFVGGETWSSATLQSFAQAAAITSNSAPIASDDTFVFAGGSTFRLPVAALLENDTDPDGGTLSITAVSSSQGSAILDGSDIIVTASTTAEPRATFEYLVSDGSGATATATAEITFWPNAAPVITSATLGPITANTPANGQIAATDEDGDPLLYTLKDGTGPVRGSVAFANNGVFTYTPGTGQVGTDSFTVLVSDPYGASAERTISLTISPATGVNHAPVITGASLSAVQEDTPATGLVQATDADGDALSFSVKTGAGPTKGSVTFAADGTFTYQPFANANGPDSFIALVSDGHGGTAQQLFDFTIAAANDAPVANDDTGFQLKQNKSITISSAQLLRNDTDPDGDSLSLLSVTALKGGTAKLDANGNVLFQASKGFKGTAQFAYTASDGHGGQDSAVVSIKIGKGGENVCEGTGDRDDLHGSDDDDVFWGHDDADILRGGDGSDIFRIDGEDGWDRIFGGNGYDIVRGGNGDDHIHVCSNFANLDSIEEIDGGVGRDWLIGTSKADVLDLATLIVKNMEMVSLCGGDDWVSGTSANETFVGGAGRDTFHFNRGSGRDVITDFQSERGGDILDLKAWNIASLASLARYSHQNGRDLVIDLDNATSITLKSETFASIKDNVWL